MDGLLHHNDTSTEARHLFRSFSFDLESQTSPNPPSDSIARGVVRARDLEDQREHELAEWRK